MANECATSTDAKNAGWDVGSMPILELVAKSDLQSENATGPVYFLNNAVWGGHPIPMLSINATQEDTYLEYVYDYDKSSEVTFNPGYVIRSENELTGYSNSGTYYIKEEDRDKLCFVVYGVLYAEGGATNGYSHVKYNRLDHVYPSHSGNQNSSLVYINILVYKNAVGENGIDKLAENECVGKSELGPPTKLTELNNLDTFYEDGLNNKSTSIRWAIIFNLSNKPVTINIKSTYNSSDIKYTETLPGNSVRDYVADGFQSDLEVISSAPMYSKIMYLHAHDGTHNGIHRDIWSANNRQGSTGGMDWTNKDSWNTSSTIFRGSDAKPAKGLYFILIMDKK